MRAPESSHSSRSTTLKGELDKESGDHYQTSKTKCRCVQDLSSTALAVSLQAATFLHPSERAIPKVLHTIFCNATNSYIRCPLVALNCLDRNIQVKSSLPSLPFHPLMPQPSSTALHHHPPLSLCPHWCCLRQQDPVWTPVPSRLPTGRAGGKSRGSRDKIHLGTGGRREGW